MAQRGPSIYRCPHCGDQNVGIIDSRQTDAGKEIIVRRRRRCRSCEHRFTTYEISDLAYASICQMTELLRELFPRKWRTDLPSILSADDTASSVSSGEQP